MTPLADTAAEQAVLGAILLNPDMFAPVASILCGDPADIFTEDENISTYRAILDTMLSGKPVDIILVAQSMCREIQGDSLWPYVYVSNLTGVVPTSVNAEHYARVVMDFAERRALIEGGKRLQASAEDTDVSPAQAIADLEDSLAVVTGTDAAKATQSTGDVVSDVLATLDNPGGMMGLRTGYGHLDDILCGLHRGDMVVLAARPSVGKTALALNFAHNIAVEGDGAVLFFSLEMAASALVNRLLCIGGHVSGQRWRNGMLTDEQKGRLRVAAQRLTEARFTVNDSSQTMMADVESISKSHAARGGLDLIVVDYLQLMGAEDRRESRQVDVADMSRAVKGIARDLNVPILVLSQLNRTSADEEPRLSHLRESGAIEQDADVVLLMQAEGGDSEQVTVKIAKQRNGPTGRVVLKFERWRQRFESQT